MEFFSVNEMNGIRKYAGKTMKLESTILRKVTEAQYMFLEQYMFFHIHGCCIIIVKYVWLDRYK